jgi:hypothetical protein
MMYVYNNKFKNNVFSCLLHSADSVVLLWSSRSRTGELVQAGGSALGQRLRAKNNLLAP